MAKKNISHRDIQKVNKIKTSYDWSIRYISDSIKYDSDSYLYSLSDWDTPESTRREINMMDHVVSTNIIDYNQVNDVVGNKLQFYISNHLASGTVK